jgi:choline monooxygenase
MAHRSRDELCDAGRFSSDPERSHSLPGRFYTDPEIFALEKEKVFFRTWQYVGPAERLAKPGDYLTYRLLDQNILIIRGADGELRAFYNVCQHRAHELLEGSGHVKVITCPYHAWSYNLDGGLRTARGTEKVAGFERSEFCLKPVRVEEFCGFVLVNLDPGAPSFRTQIPELEADIRRYAPDLDRLTLSRRLSYDWAANWKNVVDNFLECYHCPVAGDGHRAFVELIDMDSWVTAGHDMYVTSMGRARPGHNSAYNIADADVLEHAMWWVWPNILLLRYPGRGNFMVWNQRPIDTERTHQTFDLYFLDDTPTAAEQEEIRYLDEILQPEDIAIVESVQWGQHSEGYTQGRFMVDPDRSAFGEHGVHHFHRMVLDALSS